MTIINRQTVQIVPPTAEPISLAQAKRQLRVDHTDDDTFITALIAKARNYVEHFCDVQIVAATFQQKWDCFPACSEVWLDKPPLQSVSSITYVDSAGTTQTLATSVYTVVTGERPGKIKLAYNQTWPTTRAQPDAVTVTFRAGYLRPFTADASTDALTFSVSEPADLSNIVLSTTDADLPAPLAVNTLYDTDGLPGLTCAIQTAGSGSDVNITDAGTGTHFIGVLPETATQAMLMLLSYWYTTRNSSAELPAALSGVNNLLSTLNWGAV